MNQPPASSSVLQEISEVLADDAVCDSCREAYGVDHLKMWCAECLLRLMLSEYQHTQAVARSCGEQADRWAEKYRDQKELTKDAQAEIEGLQQQELDLRILIGKLALQTEAAEARAEAAERERDEARDEANRLAIKAAEGERELFTREGTTPPTASPVRDAGEGEQA